MMSAAQELQATLAWLSRRGEDIALIVDERLLYAAMARALGKDPAIPASRKQAARAIRHYTRTGEWVSIPAATGEIPLRKAKKWVIRERLKQCFEVGDVGESRPGLLELALANRRPTRITLLFERQGGVCFYCPQTMLLSKDHKDDPRFATLDHVHPKSKGGIRSAGNSVAACQGCNSRKGSMPVDEFVGAGMSCSP